MDAVRRMVRETAREACRRGVPDQRRSAHLQAALRRLFHGVRTRWRQTEKAVREYLRFCRRLVAKTAETFSALSAAGASALKLCLIDGCPAHAKRQIDQVSRRLLRGETIPQDEKVFSIFEPHTRWITEGKAGSPVDPVVPMAVVEDQYQFITVMRSCRKAPMSAMPFRSSRRRRSGFRNSGPAASTAAFTARRTAGSRLPCLI